MFVALASAILKDMSAQGGQFSSLKDQAESAKAQFDYDKERYQSQYEKSKLDQERQRELSTERLGLQQQQLDTQKGQSRDQLQDASQAYKDEQKAGLSKLGKQETGAFTRGRERKIKRWGL